MDVKTVRQTISTFLIENVILLDSGQINSFTIDNLCSRLKTLKVLIQKLAYFEILLLKKNVFIKINP